MEERRATYREIREWYKLSPKLNIWTTKDKGNSRMFMLHGETWYGGYYFNSGWFAFIQCKLFAIHIRLIWWKLDW